MPFVSPSELSEQLKVVCPRKHPRKGRASNSPGGGEEKEKGSCRKREIPSLPGSAILAYTRGFEGKAAGGGGELGWFKPMIPMDATTEFI